MYRISFFFNDTATTEIYTLSLHDALPIYMWNHHFFGDPFSDSCSGMMRKGRRKRSEEHTSELQSRPHLVCRLLLEKKKNSPHLTSQTLHLARGAGFIGRV